MVDLKILSLLDTDPQQAVIEIRLLLETADASSRHALLDCLVGTLLSQSNLDSDLVTYATELVALDRDASHLLMLAQVFERLGDHSAASRLREEAKRTPDRHLTDEIRRLAKLAGINEKWLE